ncbi:MAG: hypothetical protein EDX89_16890 [Acidobacteria bacterium]|nr:MAG: hypothetical protein EDX89_16890 [Acidobacteriota bacterium]
MLAPLLAAALPLLLSPQAPGRAEARPSAPATPASVPSAASARAAAEVAVTSVEPAIARVGERLTLTGRGLSRVKAVLFGTFCPVLVEQTDEKIVFVVPFDRRHPEGFEAAPFLLVPGREVLVAGSSVQVRYGSTFTRPESETPSAIVLLDERVSVRTGSPRRFEVQVPRVKGLVVEVKVEGGDGATGEVSVRLEPLDAAGAGATRVTYGGRLVWKPNRRELFGARAEEDSPRKLALTLTSDAARDLPVSVSVRAGAQAEEPATRP